MRYSKQYLLLSALLSFQANADLSFVPNESITNQLAGPLHGMVKFAQTHTINPNNTEDEMPRLIANRDALMIFMPQEETIYQAMSVTAYDKGGAMLGSFKLNPPKKQPQTDRVQAPTETTPAVVYSERAWTGILPWSWVQPGLRLVLETNDHVIGELRDIDVGPRGELLINTIRIGMLVNFNQENRFEMDPFLASDYFQKIPVSKLIVSHYSPYYLDSITLSDGVIYTTASPDEGSALRGDLREQIAKTLIAMGIDNANYGISSTQGNRQKQPQFFRQITAHIARGRYANGIVNHGLSGGNGMATLLNSVGNEFSHELGHAYGLGHYVGGGRWSTHNPDSGWGWDAYLNRFIVNFYWDKHGNAVCQHYVTPPFAGIYQYNKDAMASGTTNTKRFSKYTLYTGYSAKRIQWAFEKTGQLAKDVESGYVVWDDDSKQMVELHDPLRKKPADFGVPVTTLIGFYDPEGLLPTTIYPPLFGSYGYVYNFQTPTIDQCHLDIEFVDNSLMQVPIESKRFDKKGHMNKFHVNVPTLKNPTSATVICPKKDITTGEIQAVILDSRELSPPSVKPLDTVIVGEEVGYKYIAQSRPTIDAALSDEFTPFRTIDEFEDRLSAFYGSIYTLSTLNKNPTQVRVGQVYGVENRELNTRDYFLKMDDQLLEVPPPDHMSNDTWTYLGSSENYINFNLNPLFVDRTSTSSDEQIKRYFDTPTLYHWNIRYTTTVDRAVFVLVKPTGERVYFLQKRAGKGESYPLTKKSNADWYYVGSSKDLTNISDADKEAFAELVRNWYKQDELGKWDRKRRGTVGTVYRYDNPISHTVDYFKLLVPIYAPFPIHQTSSHSWESLGSYHE